MEMGPKYKDMELASFMSTSKGYMGEYVAKCFENNVLHVLYASDIYWNDLQVTFAHRYLLFEKICFFACILLWIDKYPCYGNVKDACSIFKLIYVNLGSRLFNLEVVKELNQGEKNYSICFSNVNAKFSHIFYSLIHSFIIQFWKEIDRYFKVISICFINILW